MADGAAGLHGASLRSVACVDSLEAAEEAGDDTGSALLDDRWPAAPWEGKPRGAEPKSHLGINRPGRAGAIVCLLAIAAVVAFAVHHSMSAATYVPAGSAGPSAVLTTLRTAIGQGKAAHRAASLAVPGTASQEPLLHAAVPATAAAPPAAAPSPPRKAGLLPRPAPELLPGSHDLSDALGSPGPGLAAERHDVATQPPAPAATVALAAKTARNAATDFLLAAEPAAAAAPHPDSAETGSLQRSSFNTSGLFATSSSPAKPQKPASSPARRDRPAASPAKPGSPTTFSAEPSRQAAFSAEPARPTTFTAEPSRQTAPSAESNRPNFTSTQPARPAAPSAEPKEPAVSSAELGWPAPGGPPRRSCASAHDSVEVTIAGNRADHPMAGPGARDERRLVDIRAGGAMSILTPVFPDNVTLALLVNQLKSANIFMDLDTFHEWVFVTPGPQVDDLVHFLEAQLRNFRCLPPEKFRVIPDDVCVPEFHPWRLKKLAGDQALYLDGWMKQQLLKLACGLTIQTPYYLITDTDTVFLRPLEALDLLEQAECTTDSGVCDLEKQVQLKAKNDMQSQAVDEALLIFQHASAVTLKMAVAEEAHWRLGVTPQTMSVAVVSPMAEHLQGLAASRDSWRGYLLRTQVERMRQMPQNIPDDQKVGVAAWTEYDLYTVYAAGTNRFWRYHARTVLANEEANLWEWDGDQKWEPCKTTLRHKSELPRFWVTVQSRLSMSATAIWKRLQPCMHPH